MSELVWAQAQLHENVAPAGSAQYVQTRIRNAAQKLGWKFSRTRAVWYGDDRTSLKPKELRRIGEVTGIEYGREEVREIEALIQRADALAASEQDEGVYSAFATAFRAFIGALDRSRIGGGNDRREG